MASSNVYNLIYTELFQIYRKFLWSQKDDENEEKNVPAQEAVISHVCLL